MYFAVDQVSKTKYSEEIMTNISEPGADDDVGIPKTKRASPGYSAHVKNMQEILEMLKQQHEENFTPEQ